MEIFIYTIIFIIGTFFGSFFTLAVYRIPKKEDILIKHSYCPNCNHKLGFFDLFPVFSYIFLNGKCKYCKNPIRARYLILEILSGLAFLLLALSVKFNVLSTDSIINLLFLLIYVSTLFIISGIDKENIKIEKSVLFFGFIIEAIYIIYQYILGGLNVYQYVMYLVLFVVTLFILNKILNNTNKEYFTQILYLILYITVFCGSKILFFTLILSLITILVLKMITKQKETELPIGFYLSISNILIITISNIVVNYII